MNTESAEKPITTGEVARLLGVCKTTILRWIRVGFIPEPPFVQVGRVRVRMWMKSDLMRALYHRKCYYYWTRDQINESERREKLRAESNTNCGTRTTEPGAAQA